MNLVYFHSYYLRGGFLNEFYKKVKVQLLEKTCTVYNLIVLFSFYEYKVYTVKKFENGKTEILKTQLLHSQKKVITCRNMTFCTIFRLLLRFAAMSLNFLSLF